MANKSPPAAHPAHHREHQPSAPHGRLLLILRLLAESSKSPARLTTAPRCCERGTVDSLPLVRVDPDPAPGRIRTLRALRGFGIRRADQTIKNRRVAPFTRRLMVAPRPHPTWHSTTAHGTSPTPPNPTGPSNRCTPARSRDCRSRTTKTELYPSRAPGCTDTPRAPNPRTSDACAPCLASDLGQPGRSSFLPGFFDPPTQPD